MTTRRKPSPRNVADAERRAKAISLRKAGATFEQIAQQVGYSDKSAAYNAVQVALQHLEREPAEELLTLELARLDDMQLALASRVRGGDEKAIMAALAVMDRRARYLGLNDFETRMAAAAEQQAAMIGRDVTWLYQILSTVVQRLNLSDEQQALAPVIIAGELEALAGEPETGDS